MASSRLNPPKFNEDMTYYDWKKKLDLWASVTEVPKKKQGAYVVLHSLQHNVRADKAAADVTVDDLNKDEGMTTLLEKLDEIFKAESSDEAYKVYMDFSYYKRLEELEIIDYIMEFEHRYARMVQHEMVLPDTILAFKLLDAAGLNEERRQLVMTLAGDLKFSSMKSALKRIFSSSGDNLSNVASKFNVKEEAFVSKSNTFFKKRFDTRMNPEIDASKALPSPKLNPLDRYGKVSRCAICESKMHWVNACPHNPRRDLATNIANCPVGSDLQSSEDGDINMIFLNSEDIDRVYSIEVCKSAILDTACSKTVAGKLWYDSYLHNLSEKQKETVQEFESKRNFRFGDGRQVKAEMMSILPIQIGMKRCFLEVEIIEEDIPLLLSKQTLKKLGTVLDMNKDTAKILGQKLGMRLSANGHYCIEVLPKAEENRNDILLSDAKVFNERDVLKIHKQFGHASADNLKRLFRNAGKYRQELPTLVEKAVKNCEICQVYKKQSPRPIVALPRGTDFNQSVAIDLHQIDKGVWFMHMIDEFTRYSSATVITTKSPSTIVRKFMIKWISVFGPPTSILTDNGGEFDSTEFKDMCENFNIKYVTTPAYSPWSNGVCERHNKVLKETFLKVKEEMSKSHMRADVESALAWSVHAKNSLLNSNGFSPNQLVFGRSARLPSVIEDKLPALEGISSSINVALNLVALHHARKAFLESECSDKIRRCLRKQVRSSGVIFNTGDEVYYKREDQPRWRGPGKVIGQDGPVVFIRHGGQYIKAHSCRVQHVNHETHQKTTENPKEHIKDECSVDEDQEYQDGQNDISTQQNPAYLEPTSHGGGEVGRNSCSSLDQPLLKEKVGTSSREGTEPGQSSLERPLLKGKVVKFEINNQSCEAKILGRAGKATGKFKHAYNVEYLLPENLKGTKGFVNFDQIDPCESEQQAEEVHVMNEVDFGDAKLAELQSWRDNKVYEEVADKGQNTISVRWICTLKNTGTSVIPKARLVARGFEEKNQDFEKDSPTCAKDSLRVVLSIIAQRNWKLNTIDIKTAFLQGKAMQREVYLKPPKEARTNQLWKLNKCVYGLSDASLKWYERMKSFMINGGAKMSSVDSAVFYYFKGEELHGVLAIHVDDILWSGTEYFERVFVENLRATFKIGCEKTEAFKYLGLRVHQNKGGIFIDQEQYIEHLKQIPVPKRPKEDTVSSNEKDALRSCIGQLLWISNQTRPDVSFQACILANRLKTAKVKDLSLANKVIRKVKNTPIGLRFQNVGPVDSLKIIVYSDAAHANLEGGGSQGGHLIFLVGDDGTFTLLSWQSKKVRRVARSTLMAETLALSDAMDTACVINAMISEIFFRGRRSLPIEIVTDNKSLNESLLSNKNVSDKRLRIEISALREMIERKEINKVHWVESKEQLADVMTKDGAPSEKLRQLLTLGTFQI